MDHTFETINIKNFKYINKKPIAIKCILNSIHNILKNQTYFSSVQLLQIQAHPEVT